MATLYMTDGRSIPVTPDNGTDFSLEELQSFVGGFIEILPIGDKLLVCNEEGKLLRLPLNDKATLIANKYYTGDHIVGNALVCDRNQIK